MAIKINVKKVEKETNFRASKFFGAPVVPEEWVEDFYDDVIFLGQIRLEDIVELDKENKLPHTGYLYFFIDAESYPFGEDAYAMVRYYAGEPNVVIDDFNEGSPIPEGLNDAFLMDFELCSDYEDGTKLFGIPSNIEEEDVKILLQYDPLDFENVPFLSMMDGYAYFIYNEESEDVEDVVYEVYRS